MSRSTRRTDHDDWKNSSSAKRGSYFGSVPKRVKKNLSKIRESRTTKRLTENRRKSVKVRERRSEGVRHRHKKAQETKRRLGTIIKEDEEEIERLSAIQTALNKKVLREEEELESVGKDNKALEKRRKKFADIYNTLVKENNRLCDEGLRLQEEMKRSKRNKTKQREQYNELIEAAARIETRLNKELSESNVLFNKRMNVLRDRIQELQGEVLRTRYDDTVVELEMAREHHERVSQLMTDLKFELSDRKALGLHQALRKTLHAQKEKESKLHQIILHLQKEQHVTNVRLRVLGEESKKYKRSLGLVDDDSVDDDNVATDRKDSSVKELSTSVSKLEEKLRLARLHTSRLQNHLKSDEFKNKSKEEKRLVELEKQRSELLIRAQELEELLCEEDGSNY